MVRRAYPNLVTEWRDRQSDKVKAKELANEGIWKEKLTKSIFDSRIDLWPDLTNLPLPNWIEASGENDIGQNSLDTSSKNGIHEEDINSEASDHEKNQITLSPTKIKRLEIHSTFKGDGKEDSDTTLNSEEADDTDTALNSSKTSSKENDNGESKVDNENSNIKNNNILEEQVKKADEKRSDANSKKRSRPDSINVDTNEVWLMSDDESERNPSKFVSTKMNEKQKEIMSLADLSNKALAKHAKGEISTTEKSNKKDYKTYMSEDEIDTSL